MGTKIGLTFCQANRNNAAGQLFSGHARHAFARRRRAQRVELPTVTCAPVLYSVNSYIKFRFNEQYAGGVHWVWCSEAFDARKSSSYSSTASLAPSSNPADIYRALKADVSRRDKHSALIKEKRESLINLVVRWHRNKVIDESQQVDALATIDLADFEEFRPLLYVIPRAPLGSRLITVSASERAAALGSEYQIHDLRKDEFDVIEFD